MAKGISVQADVLVNQTADGVPLDSLWAEVQEVLELWNTERQTIADLLSYKTVAAADAIAQSISSESFEEASEFGVPHSTYVPADVLKLGYSYKDYDLALRSTWKFLREATAEQVRAQVTRVLEADNKLTNGIILRRLLDPTVQLNEWGHNCYGLWNSDGIGPTAIFGYAIRR